MNASRLLLRCCAFALTLALCCACAPPLRADGTVVHQPMLATADDGSAALAGWWLSEKLDGVRGYWDGARLWSKGGNRLTPPAEFVAGLPPFALEGELWGGRGSFERTAAIVRRDEAEPGWRELRFAIFDVPAPGPFSARIAKAREWFALHPTPYAFVVEQKVVADRREVEQELQRVTAAGGEGVMVRDPAGPYLPGRSRTLLKIKEYQDAEGVVVGHLPGRGENEGRLGALLVERPDGVRFRLGSGFSRKERDAPPPIGATVTYKYYGLHPSGQPRFPSFMRLRAEP